MNEQRQYLKELEKTTKEIIGVCPQNKKGYAQYFTQLHLLPENQPIFARSKIKGEIFFDIELKGEKHKNPPTKEEWKILKQETERLTAFLTLRGIPFIEAMSGRGIHIHIFTTLRNDFLEKLFFQWIIENSNISTQFLDDHIMKSIGEKKIRCLGSKHLSLNLYKSLNSAKKSFEEVEYPKRISLYRPTKKELEELYKLYEEQQQKREFRKRSGKIELTDCNLVNYALHNKLPQGKRAYVFSKNFMALKPNNEQIRQYCLSQEDPEINPSSVKAWKDYEFNCYELQKWAIEFNLFDQICSHCPFRRETNKSKLEKAIELSKDPFLLYKVKRELDKKIVGEDRLKLTIFLLCSTIKSVNKLCGQVTGESSAGKSLVVNETLKLFPEENIFDFTRVTKRALDYLENQNLDDLILFIGEGAGAEEALETIKLMTDQITDERKFLTIEKDKKGNIIGKQVKTKGNPAFITTTAKIIDDLEFSNRLFTMGCDLSVEQTERIVDFILQKEKDLKEVEDREFREILKTMFRFQIKKLEVKIPFAQTLKEFFKPYLKKVKVRRDVQKLLMLIKASAVLHQAQRPIIQKGGKSIVIAYPQDFWNAFLLGSSFLKKTIESMHETTSKVLKIIEKHEDDLMNEYDSMSGKSAIGFSIEDFRELKEIDLARDSLYRHLESLTDMGKLKKTKVGRNNVYTLLKTEESPQNFGFISNPSLIVEKMKKEFEEWLKAQQESRIFQNLCITHTLSFNKYNNILTGKEVVIDKEDFLRQRLLEYIHKKGRLDITEIANKDLAEKVLEPMLKEGILTKSKTGVYKLQGKKSEVKQPPFKTKQVF